MVFRPPTATRARPNFFFRLCLAGCAGLIHFSLAAQPLFSQSGPGGAANKNINTSPKSVAAPTIKVPPDTGRLVIGQNSEFLLTDAQVHFPDILQVEGWQPSQTDVINLGFTNQVYWLRFRLVSPNPTTKRHIEFKNPQLDSIQIAYYNPKTKQLEQVAEFGDVHLQPGAPRPDGIFPGRNLALPNGLYYIRVQTTSAMLFAVTIKDIGLHNEDVQNILFLLGIFTGLIGVMALYNLFLLGAVRDIAYLYYSLYLIFLFFLQLWLNGLDAWYFFPEDVAWRNLNGLVAGFLMAYFGLLFTTDVLRINADTYPRLAKVFKYLAIFYATVATTLLGYTIYSDIFGYQPILLPEPLGNAGLAVLAVVCLWAGFTVYRSGYSPARYYLTAWVLLLMGTIVFSLTMGGVLPVNNFTYYCPLYGSAIEVTLLSFALAERIKLLRKEKAEIQNTSIAVLQQTNSFRSELLNLNQELEYAAESQRKLLDAGPVLSNLNNLEMDIVYLPKNGKVGGDFYSITRLDSGKTAILIADATGHGVNAALSTMQIDVVNKQALGSGDPAERMTRINALTRQVMQPRDYFTAFLLEIDGSRLTFSSAGHPPQLLYSQAQGRILRLKTPGMLVGVRDHIRYAMDEAQTDTGDLIFLFSDGVYDQFQERNRPYGITRMIEDLESILANRGSHQPLQTINRALLDTIAEFTGHAPPTADITLISMRVLSV